MSKNKDYLKEWYDTGRVGDGEEVVASRMPDSFQQMRATTPEPNSQECPPDPTSQDTSQKPEVEVEIEVKPGEEKEPSPEIKALQDVYIKTGVLFDTLHQYRDAIERGDEAMQTEFVKERLKNLSVELMRLMDAI